MTHPDIIRAELDQAIAFALQNSAAATKTPSRTRKVTRTDMIKALIFMEGGSLQKELREARLPITSSAFVQRRRQLSPLLFDDVLTAFNTLHCDRKTYQGYRCRVCLPGGRIGFMVFFGDCKIPHLGDYAALIQETLCPYSGFEGLSHFFKPRQNAGKSPVLMPV